MKIKYANNIEEYEKAVTEMEAEGFRLAAMSNAGLPIGRFRLTFLPASTFTDNKDNKDNKK